MILWAEGFDHYGTSPNGGRDAMLSGAWAEFSAGNGNLPVVSNERARTGSFSLKLEQVAGANAGVQARRVLGAGKVVVGVAWGVYLSNLPPVNNKFGFAIRNGSNQDIARFSYQSDGSIGVQRGNTHIDVGSSDPALTASSWNHVEVKLTIDDIVGDVEVKINGTSVLLFTDVNFGTSPATQCAWGCWDAFSSPITQWIDDIVPWDDTTAYNNDFLGQQRVQLIWPDADTAAAAWTKVGAANGFDCIDNVPPDGDTTYLSSNATNDTSEFAISDMPPETSAIRGVYIPVMAKLQDAGSGNIQVSMISAGDVSAGPSVPLTTAYTYWGGVHELNPDTGLPWTKATLEAALVRIKKTG